MAALILSWVPGVGVGCTLLPYPTPALEDTDARCHDGVDNDLDGELDCAQGTCSAFCHEECVIDLAPGERRLDDDHDGAIDCDDDDCFGVCPEDVLEACGDAQDDDRDGLTDFADPGCWPFADVRIAHCASVPASSRTFDFDGGDELWAARDGVLILDPTGRFDGASIVAQPGGSAAASYDGESTGATAGTRLSFDTYLGDAVGSVVTVILVVEDAPLSYSEVLVELGHSPHYPGSPRLLLATALSPDGSYAPATNATPFAGPTGWYHVELEIDERSVLRASATAEDGSMLASLEQPLVGADPFRATHRFGIRVTARQTGASVVPIVVGEITLDRDALLPCGFAVPGPEVVIRGAEAYMAAVRADLTCIGGWSSDALGRSIWLARSEDRAVSWQETRGARGELLGGGLAADGRFHMAGRDEAGLVFVTSTGDCSTLEGTTTLRLPILSGGLLGYAFDGSAHEFVSNELVDGAPGWVLHRVSQDARLLESILLGPADGRATITRAGNDVVFATERTHAVYELGAVSIGPRRETSVRTVASFGPSARAGACDEAQLRLPAVAVEPAPTEEGAAATGLLLFTCTSGGRNGVVVDRFSVFAP